MEGSGTYHQQDDEATAAAAKQFKRLRVTDDDEEEGKFYEAFHPLTKDIMHRRGGKGAVHKRITDKLSDPDDVHKLDMHSSYRTQVPHNTGGTYHQQDDEATAAAAKQFKRLGVTDDDEEQGKFYEAFHPLTKGFPEENLENAVDSSQMLIGADDDNRISTGAVPKQTMKRLPIANEDNSIMKLDYLSSDSELTGELLETDFQTEIDEQDFLAAGATTKRSGKMDFIGRILSRKYKRKHDEHSTNYEPIFKDRNLEILTPSGRILKNVRYSDLLNLEKNIGFLFSSKILISGYAGSGKSTLVRELAYEWAVKDKHLESTMLFCVEVRKIMPGMSLFDTIHNQLLPEINSNHIEYIMQQSTNYSIIIFDGYDECGHTTQDTVERIITESIHIQNFDVLLTTRPDRNTEFFNTFSGFIHIPLSYSEHDLVDKKCSVLQNALPGLIKEVGTNAFLIQTVYDWLDEMVQHTCEEYSIFETYKYIMTSLVKRFVSKYVILRNSEKQLNDIVATIGIVALKGYQEHRVVFEVDDFESVLVVETGIKVGVITIMDNGCIQFVNKIFQDYLAAAYLVTLTKSEQDKYISEHVTTQCIQQCAMFLVVCCGMNESLSVMIISRIAFLSADNKRHDHNLYEQYLLNIGRLDLLWNKYKQLKLPSDSPLSVLARLLLECELTQSKSLGFKLHPVFKELFDQSSLHIYAPKKTAVVDHTGGLVYLPEAGACLEIPRGCIKMGEHTELSLSVHWSDESPTLKDNEYLIGPTVLVSCHPKSTVLHMPLILTLPHSASNIHRKNVCVHSRLFISDPVSDSKAEWSIFPEDDVNSSQYEGLDINTKLDSIKIHTSKVGCYAPVYNTCTGGKGKKGKKKKNNSQGSTPNGTVSQQPSEISPPGGSNGQQPDNANENDVEVATEEEEEEEEEPHFKLYAMLFTVVEEVKQRGTGRIAPLNAFLLREDAIPAVKKRNVRSTALLENLFELDISGSGDPNEHRMEITVKVDNEWKIQVCSMQNDFGPVAYGYVIIHPLKAHIPPAVTFECQKEEQDVKVLSGRLQVTPTAQLFCCRFTTYNDFHRTWGDEETQDFFRTQYRTIAKNCLEEVLKATLPLVSKAPFNCQNPKHSPHLDDVYGCLWRIKECQNFVDAGAKEFANKAFEFRNILDAHRDVQTRIGVTKKQANNLISDVEKLVECLASVDEYFSRHFKNNKKEMANVCDNMRRESERVIEKAQYDITHVRLLH